MNNSSPKPIISNPKAVTKRGIDIEPPVKSFVTDESTDDEDFLIDPFVSTPNDEQTNVQIIEGMISQLTTEMNELKKQRTQAVTLLNEGQMKESVLVGEAYRLGVEYTRLYNLLKSKLPPNPTEEDGLPFREELKTLDEISDKRRALRIAIDEKRHFEKAMEAGEELKAIMVEIEGIEELITDLKGSLPYKY